MSLIRVLPSLLTVTSSGPRSTVTRSTSIGLGQKAYVSPPTRAVPKITSKSNLRRRFTILSLLALEHGNEIEAIDMPADNEAGDQCCQEHDHGREAIGGPVDNEGNAKKLGV